MQQIVARKSGPTAANAADLRWFRLFILARWGLVIACLAALVPMAASSSLTGDRYPAYISAVIFIVLVNVISDRIVRHKATIQPNDVAIQVMLDAVNVFAILAVVDASAGVYAIVAAVFCLLTLVSLRGAAQRRLGTLLAVASACSATVAWLGGSRLFLPALFKSYYLLLSHLMVAILLWLLFAWVAKAIPALRANVHSLRQQRARMDGLRSLGAIAAGLSHELATPLNNVKLRLARLEQRATPDVQDDITAASESLAQCEDVLRRLAATKPDAACLAQRTVRLRTLLDEVCAAWQQDEGAGGRELRITGGDGARCLVPPLALSQVFLSLLDNADEAAPKGTPIDVSLEQRDEQVVIEFADRGPGIAESVRRHFGEPFVTTKADGTGLGLYNALTLAQALGGDLTLGSRQGGGAIVAVALPSVT